MSSEFLNLCMKIHDMLKFCEVTEPCMKPSADIMLVSLHTCTAKIAYEDATIDFPGNGRMNIISGTKGHYYDAGLTKTISTFVKNKPGEAFDLEHFDIMPDPEESRRYAALSLANLAELFGGISTSVAKLVAISESNLRRSEQALFHMKHNAR